MVHEHTHSPLCCDYIYIYHQMSNFHLEASRILSWGGFTNHPTQNISSHQQPTLDVRGESSHQFDPFFKKIIIIIMKAVAPSRSFIFVGKTRCGGNWGVFFEKKKSKAFEWGKNSYRGVIRTYCATHGGWDLNDYQGLFYPLNKPSCDRVYIV